MKMIVPSTTEEKICKKNDVKARSLLLMALPNEHQLTFNQYADAQSMFIAIKARFGGNDATKKTQKALLKQQYQKLVSDWQILGVDTSGRDLNVKFLRSLPSEWDTHVVVWMNKPDFETMGLDGLYNNFKIVEQKVKRTVAGSQLVHEDLEQIHDDDLEEMDLKWNMALLSMRAMKFYQRTGRKKVIDGSSTARYDKSKAIDGGGFDWSDMAEDEIQANMALMAFSDSEVDKDWREKIFHPANHVRVEEPKKARENNDAPIIEDWVSDDEEDVESIPKEEKKSNVPIATKKESGERVSKTWGIKEVGMYNCPNAYKHMVPRAVLMRTGLKTVKNAKPLSTARSVNTVRPVSTARFVNTVRPYNTAHPKPTVSCARPKTHFQNQAQRPFYKNTALTKRSNIQNINTAKQVFNTVRPNVNTVRARGFNAVKPSACWVWRPIKPNGASLTFNKYNYIDACDTPIKSQRSGIPLCSATS
ncbi:hypothetical protein Tco_0089625 [Tanacetum coccineum]